MFLSSTNLGRSKSGLFHRFYFDVVGCTLSSKLYQKFPWFKYKRQVTITNDVAITFILSPTSNFHHFEFINITSSKQKMTKPGPSQTLKIILLHMLCQACSLTFSYKHFRSSPSTKFKSNIKLSIVFILNFRLFF